jgi:hypothetical protein
MAAAGEEPGVQRACPERSRRDAVERALAYVCATCRVRAPRRVNGGQWTAQALVSGVRRLAVASRDGAIEVGVVLTQIGEGPGCREAVARYAERTSPRLREHEVVVDGDAAFLVGRLDGDTDEHEIAAAIAKSLKVCALLADDVAGLCDARVAAAYLDVTECSDEGR